MKISRGELGYLEYKKKKAVLGTAAMAVIGFAIFIIGLFLNKMSNKNIFTVVAVLFALPAAKFLVAYIVAFPYHTVGKERFDKIKAHVTEGMTLYTDLVITSSEKVMSLDFVVVGNKQVIGITSDKKVDISYIRKYLTDGVANWGDDYKVKIVESEKLFINELDNVKSVDVDEEQEDNVKSYIVFTYCVKERKEI